MKNYLVGGVVGACITVTLVHAFIVWNLAAKTETNTQNINEIANFIRQAQGAVSQ